MSDDWKQVVASAFAAREMAEAEAIRAAREPDGSGVFAALVLRDEKTGAPIEMAQMHYEWHDAMEAHPNVVLRGFPGAGKTQQAMAKVVHAIGRNPRLRVTIGSASETPALKRAKAIGKLIDNPTARRVFPDMEPGDKWAPDSGVLEVKRDGVITDPTVQCVGLEHGNILGSRTDLAIADDVLTADNTRTPHQREKVLSNIRQKLLSRSPERFWLFCNTFDPDDAAHVFERENKDSQRWWFGNYPARYDDGTLAWPAVFGAKRLEEEHERFGPLAFAQLFLNKSRDLKTQVFRKDWLANGLARGNGKHMKWAGFMTGQPPTGYRTYSGIDLATSTKLTSDLRAIVTICVYPDGKTWEILNVETGRWKGGELIELIESTHKRFGSIVWIEDNSAQDFLVQWATKDLAHVPIRGSTTGKDKHSQQFGIEGLATEFYANRVVIPNLEGRMHPEMEALYNGMFYYAPNIHTADALMALWIARKASRGSVTPPAQLKPGAGAALGLGRR